MELTSVLVLFVIGSVTAGPYGYGTKGGAAAKADVRAAAGTYTGAVGLPLSISNGASYSGSFSKSSSSNASSSSASSSSFSYSGSGGIGGVLPSGSGCGSGNCNTGGITGTLGSATTGGTGAQAYSGASAGSFVGTFGNKVPIGTYAHKYGLRAQTNGGQDCESGSCQGTSDLSSSNGNSAGIGSQSSSDAKAAATSGVGQTTNSDCGGSGCDNIPADKCVTGQCGSKAKCSSRSCGVAPITEGSSPQYDLNECSSGHCGHNENTGYVSPGYGGLSKPSYTYGFSPYYSVKPPGGAGCIPGTPGCAINAAYSGPSDCSSGSCGTNPPVPEYGGSCTPGTFGCIATPSTTSGCTSAKCGTYPSAPEIDRPSTMKPNYSYGSSSSYIPVKPIEPCRPGTLVCNVASSPSRQVFPSISPLIPSGPPCAPGSRSCGPAASGPTDCTTGNCDAYRSSTGGGYLNIKPSYSDSLSSQAQVEPAGQACWPGTPRCLLPLEPSGQSSCTSGNCDEFPPIGGQGGVPSNSIKPIYSQGSLYFPVKPLKKSCTPGAAGCADTTSISGSGCASDNCGTHLSTQGCALGNPGCSGSTSGIQLGPSGSVGASVPVLPSYSTTTYSMAGSSSQHGEKENVSPYTGGFGGPPGILKPNEYSVTPTTNIGNKASVTSTTAIEPSSCISGYCDTHASPSRIASGAHSALGASASANAVAYTGGFGGPPGLLKPYDDGKGNIKGAAGLSSSLDLHKGVGGSGHLSGGSGSAMAQAAVANAAGFATKGGYSHGHERDGASGCGGGCSGNGSGGLGYSGSLGISKTGVLDESSYGLASAGALAKSAANASSGSRAFGNSYASSSASASAGASVKGGYGRR